MEAIGNLVGQVNGVVWGAPMLVLITGLAIVSSGMWMETDADGNGLTSILLTASAFDAALPGGTYVVTVALAVFAFTTILGWSYYGEKCWQYLAGAGSIVYYRAAWIAAVFVGPWALTWEGGARQGIDFIWLLAAWSSGS